MLVKISHQIHQQQFTFTPIIQSKLKNVNKFIIRQQHKQSVGNQTENKSSLSLSIAQLNKSLLNIILYDDSIKDNSKFSIQKSASRKNCFQNQQSTHNYFNSEPIGIRYSQIQLLSQLKDHDHFPKQSCIYEYLDIEKEKQTTQIIQKNICQLKLLEVCQLVNLLSNIQYKFSLRRGFQYLKLLKQNKQLIIEIVHSDIDTDYNQKQQIDDFQKQEGIRYFPFKQTSNKTNRAKSSQRLNMQWVNTNNNILKNRTKNIFQYSLKQQTTSNLIIQSNFKTQCSNRHYEVKRLPPKSTTNRNRI